MATQKFDTMAFLKENREMVIAKYNKLTEERFFDGITLKDFMTEVMNTMKRNYITKKNAMSTLQDVMGFIFCDHSRVMVINDRDAARKACRPNDQWMAIL